MPSPHDKRTVISNLVESGITVFERGWLSSNNVLLQGDGSSALVDSGYCTHAQQTLALLRDNLHGHSLDLLLNTHLHSDHCGGNAQLQSAFPRLQTLIPPGQAAAVAQWDPVALTYVPTGQSCPAFTHQGVLIPGTSMRLGLDTWEIHAAKGHDPHSVILFQPAGRILISADALWENGFGIVFPELEGVDAFDEVADTLDLIERLAPSIIIPGHGSVFEDLVGALQRARSRLDQFTKNPVKHRRHALKVLIKFKLLEWQAVSIDDLFDWYRNTPYLASIEQRSNLTTEHFLRESLEALLSELSASHALRIDSGYIYNA
ncbi:MBL fold metallo-hydrolase [Hydrogenophaga sp.]|uniref:MBL fold metallo-hydrolase n=1 Tax=Hydrogenophaga sp. TaxID=1904254 RepID=UPI0025B9DE04|nr:MBL fold metallo-hydrolase [Hydrogenophaga sp.]MBT9467340.1 MBL fold metallo-hydrolase [Hydrogenophaga sp.]